MFISCREAARIINERLKAAKKNSNPITLRQMQRHIQSGKLKANKINGRYLVDTFDIDSYLLETHSLY